MSRPLEHATLLNLIELANTGIIIMDSEWNVLFVNAHLLKQFHLDFAEVHYKKWEDWHLLDKRLHKGNVLHRYLHVFWQKDFESRIVYLKMGDKHSTYMVSLKNAEENENRFKVISVLDISVTSRMEQKSARGYGSMSAFDTEMQLAKNIQNNINRNIIKKIETRFFVFDFTAAFWPSSVLSGDIMNINQINRRYFSVFLGDGRGHGIPAALYSGMIYTYITSIVNNVNQEIVSTSELINNINTIAYKDFAKGNEYYFFSGVLNLIDGNSKKMVVTNAGHPFPVVIHNGSVTTIENHGPLIGISEKAKYREMQMELSGGEIFIFFTDGLFDIKKTDGEYLKEEEIYLFFEEYFIRDKKPASHLPGELKDYIKHATGSRVFSDDISLLVMEVTAKGDSWA